MTEQQLVMVDILGVVTDLLDKAVTFGSTATTNPHYRKAVERIELAVSISAELALENDNLLKALKMAIGVLNFAMQHGEDMTRDENFIKMVDILKVAHLDAVFNLAV